MAYKLRGKIDVTRPGFLAKNLSQNSLTSSCGVLVLSFFLAIGSTGGGGAAMVKRGVQRAKGNTTGLNRTIYHSGYDGCLLKGTGVGN